MELINRVKIMATCLLIAMLIVNVGCKKNEPLMETPREVENAEITAEGSFMSAAHATSGTVSIESNGTLANLNFKGFKTDNGPDLRVYVSVDRGVRDAIELGKLKSTRGDFSYDIDPSLDLAKYSQVLIWCEAFNVLFGSAALTEK